MLTDTDILKGSTLPWNERLIAVSEQAIALLAATVFWLEVFLFYFFIFEE